MPHLPYQLTEKSFRRWESVIYKVVTAYPKAVRVNPGDFSPNTCMARIRDAMRSVVDYNWPTPIDVERLKEIRPHISVKLSSDGFVVIEPKSQSVLPSVAPSEVEGDVRFSVDKPEKLELHSICLLLHRRRPIGPVAVRGLTYHEVMEVAKQYDITVIDEKDGRIVVL